MSLLRWWLFLEMIALAGWPIVAGLFPALKDRGISLARITGLVLFAYPVWLLSHGVASFGGALITFCLLLLVITALALYLTRWKTWREIFSSPREIIFSEIIYLAAFFGLALIRSFNPEIEGMWKGGGSEKFMDLNFVNSILSSSQFPPNDNWLADYPINYYYYGYYLAALLTRVTGVLPHVGYNLMVVTVYALAIQGLWGLLRNLGCRWYLALAGVYFAFFATNLKAPWIGLYPPKAGESFIPWESSRIINLPNDRTINEYPWFSFLWGDLHGHLSALPLQAALLGCCWGALQNLQSVSAWKQVATALVFSLLYGSLVAANAWDLPAFALLLLASPLAGVSFSRQSKELLYAVGLAALGVIGLGLSRLGFPLGLCCFFLAAGGILILFFATLRPELRLGGILILRIAAVSAVFGAFFLPFFSYFVPPTAGYNHVPWEVKSPIDLFLLILGSFFAILALPLLERAWGACRSGKVSAIRNITMAVLVLAWAAGLVFLRNRTGTVAATLTPAFLLTFFLLASIWACRAWFEPENPGDEEENTRDRYILVLLFLALGLILGCEFVAVKDFYGLDSMRLNTVFKFHMQGWILLSVVVAFCTERFLWSLRLSLPGVWGIGCRTLQTVLIMALMVWTLLGSWKVMEAKCSNFSTSPTLDGLAYALPEIGGADSPGGGREMSSEDARAILWLLDLQRFEPDAKRLILESPGDPYSIFGRVSAFSGIPTLIGVPNHEGIWNRGKPEALEAMSKRQRDVETLYRTSDFRKARDLLDNYKVSHVFFGTVEKMKYGSAAEKKFKKYMKELRSFGGTTIYAGYQDIPITEEELLPEEIPPRSLANVRPIQDPSHPLDQPRGVTVGADGTLYVCNSKKGTVDLYSLEGGYLRSIGSPGTTPGSGELNPEYSGPGGVAVDADGTVSVADTWNHRIAFFGPDGTYMREIKGDFWGPRNLAFYDSNLVVADTGKHRLAVFNRQGAMVRSVGDKGELTGQFIEPVGLAVIGDRLYVADVGNQRVQVFDRNYAPVLEFGVLGWEDQVGTEPYMTSDDQQTLWLTDSGKNRLQRYSAEGRLLGIYGPGASPTGPLSTPKGIAHFQGNLILGDFGKNRLLVWKIE